MQSAKPIMKHDGDFLLSEVFQDFKVEDYTRAQPIPSTRLERLRFLRVPDIDLEHNLTTDLTLSFIHAGEDLGDQGYIAVSYCCDSFNPDAPSAVPDVKFQIDDNGYLRSPRCHNEILYRAVRYAIKHEKQFLWIDQECIDQSDATEVEEHLQCMHQIFQQAKQVIGLLNFEVDTEKQLTALLFLEVAMLDPNEVVKFRIEHAFLQYTAGLIKSISRARWFSRTWTYQERMSGMDTLHLLLPFSNNFKATVQPSLYRAYGEEFAIRVGLLSDVAARCAEALSKTIPDMLDQEEWSQFKPHFKILYDELQPISAGFARCDFDLSLQVIQTDSLPPDREKPSGGFFLASLFHDIDERDNRVISDRVAIFANVAKLENRIKTTEHASYSRAIFFLLLENGLLPSLLIRIHQRIPAYILGSSNTSIEVVLSEVITTLEAIKSTSSELKQILHENLQSLIRLVGLECPEDTSILSVMDDLHAETITMEDVPWMSRSLTDVKAVVVIPDTATISEVLEGIVSRENNASLGVSHEIGKQIVEHGIEKGQLPVNTEYIAFTGQWTWRRDFIDQHFPQIVPYSP